MSIAGKQIWTHFMQCCNGSTFSNWGNSGVVGTEINRRLSMLHQHVEKPLASTTRSICPFKIATQQYVVSWVAIAPISGRDHFVARFVEIGVHWSRSPCMRSLLLLQADARDSQTSPHTMAYVDTATRTLCLRLSRLYAIQLIHD